MELMLAAKWAVMTDQQSVVQTGHQLDVRSVETLDELMVEKRDPHLAVQRVLPSVNHLAEKTAPNSVAK